MNKNILIVCLIALTLTACSNIPDRVLVDTTPAERPKLIVPEVDLFKSRNVQWVVITQDNVEDIFDQKNKDGELVFFAITDQGYENLSLNMADLIKLIKQQKAIIAAYQDYYENEVQP